MCVPPTVILPGYLVRHFVRSFCPPIHAPLGQFFSASTGVFPPTGLMRAPGRLPAHGFHAAPGYLVAHGHADADLPAICPVILSGFLSGFLSSFVWSFCRAFWPVILSCSWSGHFVRHFVRWSWRASRRRYRVRQRARSGNGRAWCGRRASLLGISLLCFALRCVIADGRLGRSRFLFA